MYLFWFSFVAGFVFVMWSFFAAPFFEITEIKLPNNNTVTSNDVYKLIADSMYFDLGKNLFILPKNKIAQNLTATFPEITDINIKKELFHRLVVDFEKRTQIGIWCRTQTNECFYFDKEGIIFKEAPQTEGSLILKIEDSTKNSVSLGDSVLNDRQLTFMTSFNKKIIENNSFNIIKFRIKSLENRDLEAITNRGWSIYLDQSQDPTLEANNLFTILGEIIKEKSSRLEYVDLRIPTRVFYKFK